MRKFLFIISATVCLSQNSSAQQIPFYSQYYLNPYIYNPAFAGADEHVTAFLMHRAQWRNIEGAPVTSALSIDGPVKSEKIGLGFNLYNDVSNILERTGISTSYSYRLNINDDHRLYFGLQVGLLDNRINFGNSVVVDENDPMLYNPGLRKTSLDAGFGLGYRWKGLELGAYIPQLPSTKVNFPGTEGDRSFYRLSRHYVASAKYIFEISEDREMSVYPMILTRYIPGAPLQADFNGVFDWTGKGWLGVSYRMDYAVGINLGISIKDGLALGYAYDYILGNIGSFSGASHEIALSYRFGKRDAPILPNMVDPSEIDELRRKTNENSEEIRKLRESLEEELKKFRENPSNSVPVEGSGSETTPGETGAERSAENFENGDLAGGRDFMTDNKDFFIKDNGEVSEKGMYVILGAFKSKTNATKAVNEFKARGYPDADFIFNKKISFYEVYVSHPSGTQEAVKVLMEARKEYPDAWILILE